MLLAIFGGTGRTGRQLVSQALERGHTVRALVRTGGTLGGLAGVTEVVGDVLDPAAVARTVAGCEAVLSTLGGGPASAPGVTLSRGMRNIVAAMREAGVARVIAVANSGILDAPDGSGLRMDQPDFAAMYRAVALEHAGTWAALRESDRDWTLACAPDIVDGPSTGSWDATPDVLPEHGRQIHTGNLADFILDELDAGRFVGTRVGVTDGEP